MGFLSERALQGLKAYQYKPGGYTWLDDIHTPLWNWSVKLLPMWLAPNLITLSGLAWLIVAYLVNLHYLPDFVGDAPAWTYLLSAIAIVVYTNLDCLDGKQARRTKSSSPLGQLFDHGCDAISFHFMLANVQCALNYSSSPISALVLISVMVPWFFAHWEEYHTGSMQYGNGSFGILEANYSVAAVSLVSGLFGTAVWSRHLSSYLPAHTWPKSLPDIEVRTLFFAVATVGAWIQFWGQLLRMMSFTPDKMPAVECGHKELGHAARIKHLVYIVALLGLGYVLLSDGPTEHLHARLDSAIYGIVYAAVATQLIMDHMCKEPFQPPLVGMGILVLSAANSIIKPADQYVFSAVLFGAVLSWYLYYVTAIVNETCAFLGIQCFTIKPKPAAD